MCAEIVDEGVNYNDCQTLASRDGLNTKAQVNQIPYSGTTAFTSSAGFLVRGKFDTILKEQRGLYWIRGILCSAPPFETTLCQKYSRSRDVYNEINMCLLAPATNTYGYKMNAGALISADLVP